MRKNSIVRSFMKFSFRCAICALLFLAIWLAAAEPPRYLLPLTAATRAELPANLPDDASIPPLAPADMAIIPLLSQGHKDYLATERSTRVKQFADKTFRLNLAKLGHHPQPISLQWSPVPNATDYVLVISENDDLSSPAVFKTSASSVALVNFKAATRYYWKAIAPESGKGSHVSSFATEDLTPRQLFIPAVPNFRDIGGSIGRDNRRIRQGMVYRSAKLNANAKAIVESADVTLPENIKLKNEQEERLARVASLKALVGQNAKKGNAMPCMLGSAWQVYFPKLQDSTLDMCHHFLTLSDVPHTYRGIAATTVMADANGRLAFKMPTPEPQKHLALLTQKFQSPQDGIMQLSCCADWFWAVAVNGQIVWDLLIDGNGASIANPHAHQVAMPVRKGENRLSVALVNGTASWMWTCGVAPTPVKATTLLQTTYRAERARAQKIGKRTIGYTPGASLLSPETYAYLTQNLGIKSEIDLRGPTECHGMTDTPLAPHAKWFHYSSSWDGNMGTPSAKRSFKNVFNVFLNPDNYPIDFHCSAGKDRTGAVGFILGGLLGMPEDKLYLEWEASGFMTADSGFTHEKRFDKLVGVFQKLPGKTLNEKIESYVLSIGFTHDQINAFREIMLEPPK